MLKMNSLKVLVKMNLLVKPSKSMEMVNKKNSVMLKLMLKMNSLRVMVKMSLLVKQSE